MAQTTTAGVGYSARVDAAAAVAEALAAALPSGEAPPQLALVYATVTHDQPALLAALRDQLPGVAVAGASAEGVSLTGRACEVPRFVAIAVLRSTRAAARSAAVAGIAAAPRERGRELASRLGAPPAGPCTTLVWYDPLSGADISAFLDGLADGGHGAVFGGGAGQPWGPMVQTFQYAGDKVLSGGATALRIEGLSSVSDLTHGTVPLGIEMAVTRASGNVIEEIDGRPALDVWREQLGAESGGDADDMASWALGVSPPGGGGDEPDGLLVRSPFATDPERRTVTFQAAIPVGSRVHVCFRTREAVFDRALEMARRLRLALAGKRPVLALGFECAARGAPFLGPELANREIVEMQSLIGQVIPWIGMYTWGEIAPLAGRTELHNYTFPVVVLCDA